MAGKGPRPGGFGNVNAKPPTGKPGGNLTLNQRRDQTLAVDVRTNYFIINFGKVSTIYCYKLLLKTKGASDFSRRVTRQAVICFLRKFPPPIKCATNYSNLLVTVQPLPESYIAGVKIVKHIDEDDEQPNGRPNAIEHTFEIEHKNQHQIQRLLSYLRDPSDPANQYSQAEKEEVMAMLNILFSHRPNQYTIRSLTQPIEPEVTHVGAFKFFSLQQHPAGLNELKGRQLHGVDALDLGGGLEGRIGYFRSIRCSSSQNVLMNVNRVATAFYRPINLAELIAQTRFRNRDDLDIFIKGLRVKTTYFKQSKAEGVKRIERIFTLSGLARTDQDPLPKAIKFLWERQKSGKTVKSEVTIKDFFNQRKSLN